MTSPLRKAAALLRAELPLRTKVACALAHAQRRSGGAAKPAQLRWLHVGSGVVVALERGHLPDWRTFHEIFVYREYADDYAGAVVADLGAHRGMCLAYALAHGARCVLSHEPCSDNMAILRQVARRNDPRGSRTLLRSSAVGGASRTARLAVAAESWRHSLVDVASDAEHGAARDAAKALQEVQVVAFDEVMQELASLDRKARRIVKMDIEGAEYETLFNASDEALGLIDSLHLELHPASAPSPEAAARIVERLNRAGLERIGRGEDERTNPVVRFVRSGRTEGL